MAPTLIAPALSTETAAQLQDLLEAERDEHRRLLRLAVRQNRYMRRQDIRRMEFNAGEWRRYMPGAEAARGRRERFLRDVAEELGLDPGELRLGQLAGDVEGAAGQRLRSTIARWRATAEELVRQNSLNAVLARFCLDLVGNETEIFRQGLGGDGGYAPDGAKTHHGAGGVVEQRA